MTKKTDKDKVFDYIIANPGSYNKEIGDYLSITAQTARTLTQRLYDAGLVERKSVLMDTRDMYRYKYFINTKPSPISIRKPMVVRQ